VREAAIRGLARFGTEDDFPRIRRLFALPRPDVHGYLPTALGTLTFAAHSNPSDSEPAFWDSWYEQRRGRTRVEWAREALARTDEASRRWPFEASPQRRALDFLASRRDPRFLADFERAAQSDRFAVRVEAARAIATFNKRAGARLLIREFGSRFQSACFNANQVLNDMAALNQRVDCADPQARAAAAASWESTVAAF
jgi:hypothetical protein